MKLSLSKALFSQKADQRREQRQAEMLKALLRYEARIGGEVFGPIPSGVRREFFCLDERTWVWHEEWDDQTGHHAVTTRYDVRPNGILKSQGGRSYQALTPTETRNLYHAVQTYLQRVVPELDRLAAIA